MIETFERKITGNRFCLGFNVPVEIHVFTSPINIDEKGEFEWVGSPNVVLSHFDIIGEIRYGTVTTLNPKEISRGKPQGRGLFLTGAMLRRDNIIRVLTINGHRDVTRFITKSIGAGL